MPSMAPRQLSLDQKLAYLAAFIDGEGHVGLHRTKKGHWTRHISFCNTDEALFDAVVQMARDLGFKVSVQTKKPVASKPHWAMSKIAYLARDRDSIERLAAVLPLQSPKKRETLQAMLQSWTDIKQAGIDRRLGDEVPCESCGKPVYSCRAIRSRGGGRFCSTECRGYAQRKRKRVACETCGKEYEVHAASKSRFCSLRCFGLSKADRMRSMAKLAAEARWGSQ